MNKQIHLSYLQWKEDYCLTSEPEYKESQEYDFMQAFEAGYSCGVNEVQSDELVDLTTTLERKLLKMLYSHYGLREFDIDLYSPNVYRVTLVLDTLTPFAKFDSFLVDQFVIKIISTSSEVTKVKIDWYTDNLIGTVPEMLLDIITKLTK